jgi:hypothetical protein
MENKYFEYFNSNPTAKIFKNGKPKTWTKDDSSVRTISKILNKEWINVYDELTLIAKKYFDVIGSRTVIDEIMKNNGFNLVSVGKPKSGEKRPTVNEFCSSHKNGEFVLNVASHIIPVVNGKFYDVEDFGESSVYSWFEKY